MKRFCVELITGYIGGYCDFSAVYTSHFFDTLEEAQAFFQKHSPNCSDVLDLENLPF